MKNKRYLIGAGVIFAFGLVLGDKLADPVEHWHTITKTETKTETVESPAPPPEKYIPESCLRAMDLGEQLAHLANTQDASSTELLDLIARFRGTQSESVMAEIEEDTRAMQGRTVGTIAKLSSVEMEFDKQSEICKGER